MDSGLDVVNQRLVTLLQGEVPLVTRPFEEMGRRVGVSEMEVLERLRELKKTLIRQISAIFDSKRLGYQSTLVAARVPEEKLEAAVAVINAHPGVSHHYRRGGAASRGFNLWYTLVVPPDSRLGLRGTVEVLHELSGAEATRMLPTVRMFKIGVRFDMNEGEARSEKLEARSVEGNHSSVEHASPGPLPRRSMAPGEVMEGKALSPQSSVLSTESDTLHIRILQRDLPMVAEPFAVWAKEGGTTEAELLAAARRFLEDGRMRRFAGVIRHRQAGFTANAMGVWTVPEEEVETFGRIAAGFPAVTHCYQRPTYEDWPYNMFTMVHGRSEGGCRDVLGEISRATGVRTYAALFSSHEYKKVRVRYFMPEIIEWEAAHGRQMEGR